MSMIPFHEQTEAVELLIRAIGEDPYREGLRDTPERVCKAFQELYGGYRVKIEELFTKFDGDRCDELVLLKDIEFFSMCEHHMMPFFGKAHIGYLPQDCIVGVSKLARLLDAFARRLQIQERIGDQVTAALDEHLRPLGSACIIEARHMCMCCRGVQKQHSVMVTSSLTGAFREDNRARSELLELIRG